VRVEIMGPGKYENVGKSQSVLIMINPIIFTRTRTRTRKPQSERERRWQPGVPGRHLRCLCG
jgi:hypothetical protein